MTSRNPDVLEAEVEAQREQLARTVDALGTRLDEGKAKARTGLIAAAAVGAVVVVAVAIWRHRS